jgi:hypothetical protein
MVPSNADPLKLASTWWPVTPHSAEKFSSLASATTSLRPVCTVEPSATPVTSIST